MYKIAICDDDANYISELKEMLLECNDKKREIDFWEFTSGRELLNSNIDEMDVIFLDIQMEEMDGNMVSVELNERGYQGLLVQCSGIFMPTPETIKISPYRYLLKQSAKDEIIKELKEILDEMDKRKKCSEIEGSYLRQKMVFQVADIVYITHHTNGSSVLHLQQGKKEKYSQGNIIVPYNFTELFKILGTTDFALPHNSYIVNMRYISSFDLKKEFIIADGKSLFVSRGMKEEFFKKLMNYTTGKY